eukprot:372308-Prymnesium_polylepis.1
MLSFLATNARCFLAGPDLGSQLTQYYNVRAASCHRGLLIGQGDAHEKCARAGLHEPPKQ